MRKIEYTPDAADKLRSLKEQMFGVTSDYRYIFVAKNYVFYKIESDCIRIIDIYNEKEDFLWVLFGIDTTPQETIDYWGEIK